MDEIFASIDGSGDEVNTDKLMGGVLINRSFYHEFSKFFEDALTNTEVIDKEISIAIANSHGVKNPLFVPERAFDKIVQNLLDQYEAPIQTCVQHVREILEDVLNDSMLVLTRYPRLKHEVIEMVKREMDRNAKKATEHLLLHIQAQKAFMNPRPPDFSNPFWGTVRGDSMDLEAAGGGVAVPQLPDLRARSPEHVSRARKLSIARQPAGLNSSFYVPTDQDIKALVYAGHCHHTNGCRVHACLHTSEIDISELRVNVGSIPVG